jgi:uncharacterized protein (TIGR02246 family)
MKPASFIGGVVPWVAVVACAACASPQPPQETAASTDPTPINDIRSRFQAAYNAGDAAAVAALFADDAVSMPDHEPALEGKAAIEKRMQEVFAQYSPSISITPGETEVHGDVAHEHGTYTIELTPKAGGTAMKDNGKYLVILKREADGTWKIHHDIDNSSNPPPGAPAPEKPR